MKTLLLFSLCLISLNLFSAELGEDQKGQCPFLNQSSKRQAKDLASNEAGPEVVKTETKVNSK